MILTNTGAVEAMKNQVCIANMDYYLLAYLIFKFLFIHEILYRLSNIG